MPLSLNASPYFTYPLEGVSWRWYDIFFGASDWRRALVNSLIVGLAASALATALGTSAALGLARLGSRGHAVLTALLISPMIVPVIITGIGVYFFYARIGLNDTLIGV